MNNVTLTKDILKNNSKYGYWTSKEYVDQFAKFVDDCQQVARLVTAQYNDQKIKNDIDTMYNEFNNSYTSTYNSTVNAIQKQMDIIKNSYDNQNDIVYSDATSALNEVLRRQNFQAKLALMSDAQLNSYTDNPQENLVGLPLVDQKAVMDEFHKRGIKISEAVIQDALQNRYKSDTNYQRMSDLLSNVWTVTPNGKNTTLAYFLPQSDGTYSLQFVYVSVLDKLASLQPADANELISKLKNGLSALKSLGYQKLAIHQQSKSTQLKEWVNDYTANKDSYKVADNDPRLNENGSHWSWSVFYDFLAERYENRPEIANNPVYGDPLSPNYDIEKKYYAMKHIYDTEMANNQYRPLKIVQVPNDANPDELSNSDIVKLFGAVD